MSAGTVCKCLNPKWEVVYYKCNYSAFEYPRGEYHKSDYSQVHCKNCCASWRTKAKYVEKILNGSYFNSSTCFVFDNTKEKENGEN